MTDSEHVGSYNHEDLDPVELPIHRKGLSRPVTFVRSTEKTHSLSIPKSTNPTSGDHIADLYKSIISGSSPSPSPSPAASASGSLVADEAMITHSSDSSSHRPYCDDCQKTIAEDTMRAHVRTMAHMVCADYLQSVDFLTLNKSNVGFRMLQSQGWEYEQGLGATGEGRRHPVATVLKKDRSGLGHKKESKRVTHAWEDTEKQVKKELPRPPSGKDMARSARLESRKRVAMLRYMKDNE
ncbi:hypothetical protein BX666DRAFT_2029581 [Dichotomocladium elegans]|nr:hypothetical protein BX666DRAFT_2029581 [Dichotomocladium elegans]